MKKTLFILIAFGLWSCSSDETSEDVSDNFDRKAMMTHLADNIIIPSFENLDSELTELVTVKNNFIAQPDANSLNDLRDQYVQAYLSWQHVELYNIGKAEEILYGFQMNVYPTNVNDITSNISNGSYDLSSVNNNDAVGFPAIDYMLYGLGNTETEILGYYTASTTADEHKNYLGDLIDRMKLLTETVLNDWRTSYRDQFVNSTSNTATSAINMMINDYIFYYEKGLRANKIGIPAGVFSNTPLPDRVEGLYSKQYSKMFALEALKAVKDFFNGTTAANPQGVDTSLAGYTNSLDPNAAGNDQASLPFLIN